MQNALKANRIGYKNFFNDIGIMQKLSPVRKMARPTTIRDRTAAISPTLSKSKDLITWEYVAQPSEGARTEQALPMPPSGENAVYVLNDKAWPLCAAGRLDAIRDSNLL